MAFSEAKKAISSTDTLVVKFRALHRNASNF